MSAAPLPGVDNLYDAAPCGLLLVATGGPLLHANATFCRWLGYEREELLRERRLQDLLATGSRIFLHTHLQPLLRMQGSVSEVKLEVRSREGRQLPMIFNIAELRWQDREVWQVAAFVAEDRHKYERELLVQRQRAEQLAAQHAQVQQQLAAARAEAEDRARLAEQLVGMVSHDIRNPLSVVQMSAELLRRGVPQAQQAAVLGRIDRAVDRLQHLVGDLLDVTQARLGGGLRVRPVDADLHRTVADAVADLAVAFPGRGIRHVQQGEGRWRGDPERLAQAVGNLVANAVHHGDAQQPITVRTMQGAQDFRIEVHNHGRPIPPETLPRLFEPMVRGSGAGAKGVGLGLFIVREIVRSHGGQVSAASDGQQGTTFAIALPRGE